MDDKLTPAEKAEIAIIVDYTKRTYDTPESVTGWGGSRPGSGRPPTGRKRHFYYVTDDEDAQIKLLIAQLRGSSE